MTMARACLAGTIEYAPEKRFTPNNVAVTVFTIRVPAPPRAVARQGTSPAGNTPDTMIRVNCWRNLAEQVVALQKGQVVLIEGKLIVNAFTTQDGQPRKQFEVEASQVMVLPGLPVALEEAASVPVAVAAGPSITPQEAPLAGGYQASPSGPASSGSARSGAPQTHTVALSDLSPEEFMTEDDIPF